MTHSLKLPARGHLQEDQIDPWQSEESSNVNGLDYSPFSPYPHIQRPIVIPNPESTPKASQERPRVRHSSNNFYDNLRKY